MVQVEQTVDWRPVVRLEEQKEIQYLCPDQ